MSEVLKNEVIKTEDLQDTVETVVDETSGGNAGLVVLGIGAAIGISALVYKFVVKPMMDKKKAAKEAETQDTEVVSDAYYDEETLDEEN